MSKTKSVPSVPEGGNTKTPPNPALCWCFTYCNYTSAELTKILETLCSKCSRYIVGEEIAPKTGTPHLQGWIKLKCKNRPTSLKLMKQIHWEKAKGDEASNVKYCSKEGKYHTNIKFPKPIKTLDDKSLYKWQKDLLDILVKEPDERHIYWYWEDQGNVGKSAFCKYLAYKKGALMVDGKGADIMKAIDGYVEESGDFPEIIIVDCPRDKIDYLNYGAIEKVKNGHIFSPKYESKQLIFNCPHVVVFANETPDMTKWSKDRYKIHIIKKSECKIDTPRAEALVSEVPKVPS